MFLKCNIPSLNVDTLTDANRGASQKMKIIWHVGPDVMACYELSHQDLHCLQRYLVWFPELKGLKKKGSIDNVSEMKDLDQTSLSVNLRKSCWHVKISKLLL